MMFEGKDVHILLSQAGSGKTRRLIEEVAKELETRRPEELAFVTYTRKGAEEGLRRVCSKLCLSADDLPYFKTLHSLTFHAMGYNAKMMFSRKDQLKFNSEYGYTLNRIRNSRNRQDTRDTKYLDYYDMERSGALTSRQMAEADIEASYYRKLTSDYEEYKGREGLVDFFDCLINYRNNGEPLPVRVAMIDEAQDITTLQWQVMERAFANAEKIYIAGDENQNIYSYTGARADILIGLARTFPTEMLTMSYRIPKAVYRLAKAITGFIGDKTDKPFEERKESIEGRVAMLPSIEGIRNLIDCGHLADNRDETEWYILARNNCFLTRAQGVLEDNLIPYWTADGFFMGGDIMSRLKDYEGYGMVGYRGEGRRKEFMERYGVLDFNEPFTSCSLFTDDRKWVYMAYIEKYGLKALKDMCKWNPQVLVSTVHHVKGGEARNVAFMLDTTFRTQRNVWNDIDEELRILYVAVTRAKESLYLVNSRGGNGYDSILEVLRSENHLDF